MRVAHRATWRALTVLAAVQLATSSTHAQRAPPPPAQPFPPPQIDVRVPFEPTAFPSAGRSYLIYELHLRNFGAPVTLSRLDVLAAHPSSAAVVDSLDATQLERIVQPIGTRPAGDAPVSRLQLSSGSSAVVFMFVSFPADRAIPDRLRHRVTFGDITVEGAAIGTRQTDLRQFGPPLAGSGWVARSGPSNDSHHRRGIIVIDGQAVIDRRYAIDWVQVKDGVTLSGDSPDARSYYAHGEDVLAVADGSIVSATDGIPDNAPRREGFTPAVPITLDTLAGNTITLDVGGGQFAYYMHMQPGSVRVKPGDRVRRGQVIGRVGNSGDSREPHLHFELTNSAKLLAGEGLPYLIDRYHQAAADGSAHTRTRELPLRDMVIDFGER
jgi:murein DD-endopeptidase MepM/ murein hydrolase activator NlpD